MTFFFNQGRETSRWGYFISKLYYIDRNDQEQKVEKVYGKFFIDLLYGSHLLSWVISWLILPPLVCFTYFSYLYGAIQKTSYSRRKIKPFIRKFHIREDEFVESIENFTSFNDFFIRKLKSQSRPITPGKNIAVLPADARYLIAENLYDTNYFFVKGQRFCLDTFLQNRELAERYKQASLVIARLAPVDYHRYHFPVDCIPSEPYMIQGKLFSVNPLALKKNMKILTENKRVITHLRTELFGTILFIEIGATYVGTIHQTFTPGVTYLKGEEKGYFSFGGSCIVLLFEPGKIRFEKDLLEASQRQIEILGKFGQSLGCCL